MFVSLCCALFPPGPLPRSARRRPGVLLPEAFLTRNFIAYPHRPYAEKYAADQDAFFADYAESHKKLSELGVEWEEGGPVSI